MSKKYQELWLAELERAARSNMAKSSLAPKIDPENPNSNFDLVVSLIYVRDKAEVLDEWSAEDKIILDTFRAAKLNIEDPFHWWHMLHALIMVHTARPAGRPPLHKRPSKLIFRRDFLSCMRDHPRDKKEHLVAQMRERFPKKYGDVPPTTLLRWVSEDQIKVVEERYKLNGRKKNRKN